MTQTDLSKIPEDVRDYAKKIVQELEIVKKTNKMGLNITNLKKKTKLSHTSMIKALSSLSTAAIIDMEEVGNSKVYHIKEEK